MYSSFDDVEFLSRSASRVQVLAAITESPQSRHELRDLTGVSRVTLARILDDLEERGWLGRENGQCEATARGEVVASEFTRLLRNVETVESLDDALEWLPTASFGFDIGCLQDAEVYPTSSWSDHTSTIRYVADIVDRTSRIRGIAVGFSHEVVGAIRDGTVNDPLVFEVVIQASTLELIQSDEALQEGFREILDSGNASIAVYSGDESLPMVMLFDETVIVCGHADEGPPSGTLKTDSARVQDWAEEHYESVREDATPISPDELLVESTGVSEPFTT